MFGMGWTELLIIGIVALIVVGPKDLPVLFRNMGRFMGKARGMAREFSRAMEQAADDAGVKDAAKTFKSATNPIGSAMDGVKDAAKSMTKLDIDPDSETGRMSKERAEAAKKIREYSAKKAEERRAAEEAAKQAETVADGPSGTSQSEQPKTDT
mgnify:CR=1 FL=1